MNIVFLLNLHDIHMGIYLFIDIAHFLFSGRTMENEPCLFNIFSFIISTVCTSKHIIYLEQGRYRELPASRAFLPRFFSYFLPFYLFSFMAPSAFRHNSIKYEINQTVYSLFSLQIKILQNERPSLFLILLL